LTEHLAHKKISASKQISLWCGRGG